MQIKAMFDEIKELTCTNAWGGTIYLVKFESEFTKYNWHVVTTYVMENQDYYSDSPEKLPVHTNVAEGSLGVKGSLWHNNYEGYEDPLDLVNGLAIAMARREIKTAANDLERVAQDLS